MRIRAPRGLSRIQIVFASVLGVGGGVYIWKPIFEKQFNTAETETTPSADVSEVKKSEQTSEFDK